MDDFNNNKVFLYLVGLCGTPSQKAAGKIVQTAEFIWNMRGPGPWGATHPPAPQPGGNLQL